MRRNFREGGAKHATPIDGALDEVGKMRKRGYRLGLATNDTMDGLHASLGRYSDLSTAFDYLAGCDSGHGAKPEPGMGLAFAAAMGVEPGACAIIGDAIHDLEMGRRAGYRDADRGAHRTGTSRRSRVSCRRRDRQRSRSLESACASVMWCSVKLRTR
ncbi:MAG: HAD-IA family hydrolase [Hyphomicrobium sp.]